MKNNNSYIGTSNGATIVVNGKPYTVSDTHQNYPEILRALREHNWDCIPDLINQSTVVAKYVTSNSEVVVDIVAGTIAYKGEMIHNSMVQRIFDMMKDGFPIEPMTNLLENVYENVSKKAIDELYTFLEYGRMPITEDGCFLAYKRVNNDYTSCYDNTTKNNIGLVVSMPRHSVDDRSENTCSHGLHICSFEYLCNYQGARVIVVKVNPANVVSIPIDYNNTKARVCEYEVIGELTPEEAGLTSHSFGTSVYVEPEGSISDPFRDELKLLGLDELLVTDEATIKQFVDSLTNEEAAMILARSAKISMPSTNLVITTLKERLTSSIPERKVFKIEVGEVTSEITQALDHLLTKVSDWFKFGYTNGFRNGVGKIPAYPNATLEDDESGKMTQANIDDLNAGYALGYKDGRGHKGRKYPKTVAPSVDIV